MAQPDSREMRILTLRVPARLAAELGARAHALDEPFNDFCRDALQLHLDATESADFSPLVTLPAESLQPSRPPTPAGNPPPRPGDYPSDPSAPGGADHV